jgi:hypothetical protein
MSTLKDFIKLKWHTVPLSGQLKRLANGDKTIPEFPKDFKNYFTENFNEQDSTLGGVMTGKCSGIIAIDCDSEHAYKVFQMLDPDYEAHMVSRGKLNPDGSEMKAATIVYKYTQELEENFIHKTTDMKIDFYSNKGFIYLPTKDNLTKYTWESKRFPEIKECPPQIVSLLKSLKPQKIKHVELELQAKKWNIHLYPQVRHFAESGRVTKSLFKILTPRDFRTSDAYIAKGFLHPNDVEDGRGSEYLSKVSAILGADESIDEELYTKAMRAINNNFDKPMARSRLESTIIDPMIEERASVDGTPIWRYNKDWEEDLSTVVTKLNTRLDLFFDQERRTYYAVDVANENYHAFKKDADFFSFLETVASEFAGKKEIRQILPLVNVVSTPKYPFGFYGDHKESFNIFSPTVPLMIFKNPDTYEKSYNYPTYTIKFLEHLIPDNFMRNYLIRFLRRKFDTFDYSPVVIYLLGVSGSGKDLFVNLLRRIMGENTVARPKASEFLEKHNGWMLDQYFAQLDEYGDQLVNFADKEEAKGLIKTYSGNSRINIRKMQNDGYMYDHNITFIITANKNPLTFDADDRRIALFSTPNNLRELPEVKELGGIQEFVDRLYDEINDFMYWLAIDRDNATADEYVNPPFTMDKLALIAAKLSAGSQLAFYFKNGLAGEISRLCTMYETPDVLGYMAEGRVYEDDLFDLYMEMTEHKGTKRGLSAAMQDFDKIPTTKAGSKAYYYKVPSLILATALKMTPIEGEFQ